jgi:hypothetical protein
LAELRENISYDDWGIGLNCVFYIKIHKNA